MHRRIKTTKVTKSINKMFLLDLFLNYLLVKSRSTVENFTQVKSGRSSAGMLVESVLEWNCLRFLLEESRERPFKVPLSLAPELNKGERQRTKSDIFPLGYTLTLVCVSVLVFAQFLLSRSFSRLSTLCRCYVNSFLWTKYKTRKPTTRWVSDIKILSHVRTLVRTTLSIYNM